ncbi:MAG: ribonuclease HII [Alphaproteobacteria bacterium]|jgi:ribonuclease HII|nr:ribonuclease HII [Alphaproteobacteria bacterium]QQS56407.1 MAG: ribonuclease HII [Alphaproteobacteria bacterium]
MPDFEYEDRHEGLVCGLDEVGRGPLAGPVVAACVVIPPDQRHHDFIKGINNSKKLSKQKRAALSNLILSIFPSAIIEICVEEIDKINILQASLLAMRRSCERVYKIMPISHALVDGNKAPELPCPSTTIIKGDDKSLSIAAASIIAKVYRDTLMEKLAKEFPGYGWENNMGYPTADHIAALDRYGITAHHRKSFGPVKVRLQKSA